MLYVVGVPEVAVNGRLKAVAPWQTELTAASVIVGRSVTMRLKFWLVETHVFAFLTVMTNWYVPAAAPTGFAIVNGVAVIGASTTGTKPGMAGTPADMLYVVGVSVVAVYGTVKLLVPKQTEGIAARVMVGSGLTVTLKFWLVETQPNAFRTVMVN